MRTKHEKTKSNSSKNGKKCCKVESVISIDDRGQLVLPKDIRHNANIQSGDKFAVIPWEKDGQTYCIALMRVEQLEDPLRNVLIPLLREFEGKPKKGGQNEGS
jgi:AbrB family looped-hinge helix DNA binding protein